MSNQPNKTTRQSRLQKILRGIDLHYANTATLLLGGQTVNTADLKKLVQADLDALDASAQAQAASRVAVQVERNARSTVDPVLRLLKRRVIADFGDTPNSAKTLEDFGYAPRKSTKKTLVTKVEAQGKNLATRAARHTAGKKQKAKVKGAPAPAPAPAAAAPTVKA